MLYIGSYTFVIHFTTGKEKYRLRKERGQIDSYLENGKSIPELSKLIKRSVDVIYNYRKIHQIVDKISTKKEILV